ncbi:MAG TPA: sigma-70 family RNA polymerase sigma factor [Sandaracinaceae bacterium]
MAHDPARRPGKVVPLRTAQNGALAPAALSDAALVAAVREGDRACTLELYRRFARDAERMLVRICGFVPERADLLHDVFVRALEGIGTLRNAESVRSWIMGIAVRCAREYLRGRARAPRWTDVDMQPGVLGDGESAMELRRVYALLARLDPDDCVAFVLRRIDRRELGEVAELCGVSLATIKRRIARAERAFIAMAEEDPFLRERLDRRDR